MQSLLDNVGFKPDNAAGEVRAAIIRWFGGAAVSDCLSDGALQFRALHKDLVDSKKMTDREFADAALHENSMTIEMLRANLERQKLTSDFGTRWKYYGEHPTHPLTCLRSAAPCKER